MVMPKFPWYAAGLRFFCTQCGDCCSGAPGFVWVNEEEIAAEQRNMENQNVANGIPSCLTTF